MSTKVRAVSFAIEREIRHGLGALANYESVGDDSKILIDARARARIYERVGSIYGPATDKKQRRPGRGRIEKQPRESFGTWEALVSFSFSRAYVRNTRRRRERVSE